MLSFYYYNNITKQIGSKLPIQNNGFRVLSLELDLNQAYILDIEINPSLGKIWKDLADDPFGGIILRTSWIDLAFIKSNEREMRYIHGAQVIKFYSQIWDLSRCSLQYQSDNLYSGSLKNYIRNIDPNYNWLFLSNDKDVKIETGIPKNSFDLLKETCFSHGWSFRENGFSNGRSEILVGNYKEIDDYSGGLKYEELFVKFDPHNQFTPTKFSNQKVYLEDLRVTYNRNFATHIFVYADSATGSSKNIRVELEKSLYNFVDADYPIVQLDDGKWYIQNTQAYNSIGNSKELTRREPIAQAVAMEDLDGQEFDKEDLRERIYDEGVAFLKRDGQRETYSVSIKYLDLVLPGNYMNIEVKHWTKFYNGDKKEIINIDNRFIIRDIKYSEQELAAIIQ